MNWVIASTQANRYELYIRMEERYGHGHERYCIDGRITASGKCRGCCLYESHPGFVTEKHLADRRCENCRHYLPKPRRIR